MPYNPLSSYSSPHIPLFNITSRLFHVHTPPIEQPQHNLETQRDREIRDASQPAPSKRHKSDLRTPNTQNRRTHLQKTRGQAGIGKKKVRSEMHEVKKMALQTLEKTGDENGMQECALPI
jgi:hypothetical protein